MQTWNLLLVLTRRQRFGSRFRKQQNILELPSVTMQGGELLTSATSKLTSTTSQQTIWLHSQARTEAIVRWIPNHDCTLACLPGQIQMQIQIQIKIQIHLHTQSRKKQALPRPAEKEKCLISFFFNYPQILSLMREKKDKLFVWLCVQLVCRLTLKVRKCNSFFDKHSIMVLQVS